MFGNAGRSGIVSAPATRPTKSTAGKAPPTMRPPPATDGQRRGVLSMAISVPTHRNASPQAPHSAPIIVSSNSGVLRPDSERMPTPPARRPVVMTQAAPPAEQQPQRVPSSIFHAGSTRTVHDEGEDHPQSPTRGAGSGSGDESDSAQGEDTSIEVVFEDAPVVMPFLNGHLPRESGNDIEPLQLPIASRMSTTPTRRRVATLIAEAEANGDEAAHELYDEPISAEEVQPAPDDPGAESVIHPPSTLSPVDTTVFHNDVMNNIDGATDPRRAEAPDGTDDDDDDAFFVSGLATLPPLPVQNVLPERQSNSVTITSAQVTPAASTHATSSAQRKASIVDVDGKPTLLQPEMDFSAEPLDHWFEVEEARRMKQREALDKRRKQAKLTDATLARLSKPKRQMTSVPQNPAGSAAPSPHAPLPPAAATLSTPASPNKPAWWVSSSSASTAVMPTVDSSTPLTAPPLHQPTVAALPLSANANLVKGHPTTITTERPNESHCYIHLTVLNQVHRIAVAKKTTLTAIVSMLGYQDLALSGAVPIMWARRHGLTASGAARPKETEVMDLEDGWVAAVAADTVRGRRAAAKHLKPEILEWDSSPQSLNLGTGLTNTTSIHIVSCAELEEVVERRLLAAQWYMSRAHCLAFSEWVLRCSDALPRSVFFEAAGDFEDLSGCCV